jgi:hypothetical protein
VKQDRRKVRDEQQEKEVGRDGRFAKPTMTWINIAIPSGRWIGTSTW